MRRRATVGPKPAKTRHRKPTTPKRSGAGMTANQPNLPVSDLQEQLKRQARELDEAREERAAIAEVLRVISSSSGELEVVFEALLRNATRLCEAKFGDIFRFDGKAFRFAARVDSPPESIRRRNLPNSKSGVDLFYRQRVAGWIA